MNMAYTVTRLIHRKQLEQEVTAQIEKIRDVASSSKQKPSDEGQTEASASTSAASKEASTALKEVPTVTAEKVMPDSLTPGTGDSSVTGSKVTSATSLTADSSDDLTPIIGI